MSSYKTDSQDLLSRIPWKEFLKDQFFKLIGFLIISILIIGTIIYSGKMTNIDSILTGEVTDLELAIRDQNSLITIILSTLCFLFVLIGFSKILLFDMADEFGLRDEETHKIKYDFRFFLFSALAISFCASMYLLLDVFLENAYIQLLPVMIVSLVLVYFEIEVDGVTNLRGRDFYVTTRNLYFTFFFFVIILFSVLVFLIILTSLARKRVASRFQKDEEEEEEEANRRLFKILAWLTIPLINLFLYFQLSTSLSTIIGIIFLILLAWWLYQLAKVIFLILWRGFKITAFITSVNALLILPLIFVLYALPVITWTVLDIVALLQAGTIAAELGPIIQAAIPRLIFRGTDVLGIIQLDFVFITIIATIIVGFAEGFAVFAIFSAIFKGAEVARTGRILTRSPPKVVVVSKYLILLGFWIGLSLNSFLNIWNMLILEFNIDLPPLRIPSLVYLLYNEGIIPLSEALETVDIEALRHIPFLLLPLYFILSGGFKFLSVTIITPQIKDRLSVFFLLISTSFVLIISTVLGDIYRIPTIKPEAPLRGLESILSSAVVTFQYVEALAFYLGFIFGFFWVIRQLFFRKKPIIDTLETTIEEVEKEIVVSKGAEEEITHEERVEEEESPKEDVVDTHSPEIGMTEKIENLEKLRDEELISEEEFEQKKAELQEKNDE